MKSIILALCIGLLSGCASLLEDAERSSADPWEKMNRATFAFNDTLDTNVVKPVAQAYADTVPSFAQTGVGNFFGNINDVWSAINSFLQGNVTDGLNSVMRVSINSTFGFLGLLDIASEAQIPKRRNDLGLTMGVWGIPNGPYLVLPFLGPSVVRDTAGLPVDYYADLWTYYEPVWERNIGSAIRLVDKRASLLGSYALLEEAALDKYIFVRDAYLQRIASQIELRRKSRTNPEDAKTKQEDVVALSETSESLEQ
jgi:phospholipid-binding lipoprotein MlaA